MANTLNLGTMTLDGKPASMGFAGARLGEEIAWRIF